MIATLRARWGLVRNSWPCEIPEGWPTERGEVLLEVEAPHDGTTPALINAMWSPGCGYSVHFSVVDLAAPSRRLSEPAKQNLRRKSLARRLNSKMPLFAAEMIEQTIAAKPDYFGERKSNA